VLSTGSKPGYITDRQERIATWELWLGVAAGATKQRCHGNRCASHDLTLIPGLAPGGAAGARALQSRYLIAVNMLTAVSMIHSSYRRGNSKGPRGGYPARTHHARELCLQQCRGTVPGPDEIPYEILATAPESFKDTLLECLNKVLADGRPPPPKWLGGLVRFLST
jgi:hypothetical protein